MEIKVINRLLKNFIIWLFTLPLFTDLRRWISKRYFTILLYHMIDPDLFASHLEYLKRNYNIIPLRDVRDTFILKRKKVLPPQSLVITFDDGWKLNYKLLNVIRKYDTPVTIFLTAGLVNTNRKIWNFALEPWSKTENERLKAMPNEDKNQYLREKYGHYPEKEYDERSMLNQKEIEEMTPYVDFQSHGMFHSVLTICSKEELTFELSKSKGVLSTITNSEIYAISYPYNRAGIREMDAAREIGYKVGRMGGRVLNSLNDNPMALKAIGIRNDSSTEDLVKSIIGAQIRKLLQIISHSLMLKGR